MEILFATCTRRQRLGLGEVGHIGGHIGVVLNKNIRACNPPPSLQPIVGGAEVYTAILALIFFFHVINVGGGV